jgi:DNA mismatch repair protein MutL
MIFTCVNGRVVRDRALVRAITQAYQTLIPRGRHPAVVLFVEISAENVDVNVHPMKTEVRFRNSGLVFEAVYRTLRARLADQVEAAAPDSDAAAAPGSPMVSANSPGYPVPQMTPAPGVTVDRAAYRPLRLVPEGPGATPAQPALRLGWGARDSFEANGATSANNHGRAVPTYSELKVIGQLFAGYIALEGPDGLLLIDQHAAHERVTFERLKTQLAGGAVEVQALLAPIPLEIDPARIAQIEPALPGLNAIGFDVEKFGPATLVLKGAPAVFGAEDPVSLLTDMLDDIGDGAAAAGKSVFEDLLKQLACHGSIRVGRILNASEITALLVDLDSTAFKTNCPHGRPTHINFARGQIERMFRR